MYELSLKREKLARVRSIYLLQQYKGYLKTLLITVVPKHLKSKHVQGGCLITSVYEDGAADSR